MKNYSKIEKNTLLLLLCLIFASCLTNVEEPEVELEPVDLCADITYSGNVKTIINSSCIQCHGSGGNFPNLTTYSGVSSNATIVKNAVVSGRMPQGGSLTQEQIKAIECWVDAGAPNN